MAEVLESNLVETPKDVVIEIPVDVSETPVKKERKKKEPKPTTPKTDKKEIEKDVCMLLELTFGVVATKAGEHWKVTNEESLTIAKPLINILEKYNVLDKAKQFSDPAALIIATGMIVAPRILISKSIAENREKSLLNVEVKKGEQKRNSNVNSQQNNGNVTAETSDNNNVAYNSVLDEVQNGII